MNTSKKPIHSDAAGVPGAMIKTRTRRLVGLAGMATLLAVAGAAVPSAEAQAASGSVHGCPRGAVCIYPKNKGWNGGHPQAGGVFWSYGPHNLSGQYGDHYVLNNQTVTKPDKSIAAGCTGYNGTGKLSGPDFFLLPWMSDPPKYRNTADEHYYSWYNVNLTPVNSIVLTSPGGRYWCVYK